MYKLTDFKSGKRPTMPWGNMWQFLFLFLFYVGLFHSSIFFLQKKIIGLNSVCCKCRLVNSIKCILGFRNKSKKNPDIKDIVAVCIETEGAVFGRGSPLQGVSQRQKERGGFFFFLAWFLWSTKEQH